MIKKRLSKRTQGGRPHSHSSLAYTKRKPSDSDTSATDDSIHNPERDQKVQEERGTGKRSSPPTPAKSQSTEPPRPQEQAPPPQKVQAVSDKATDRPQGIPQQEAAKTPASKGDNEAQGEEMKKRRAEYSLEVGITSDSTSPGSTYKRERTKRFSIKRKSVIGQVDLTSTPTPKATPSSTSTAADAEKKKTKRKEEKTDERNSKKEKSKKRKVSGETKKKHTKSAMNTPFRMVHEVIRSSFKRKITPACSKAPNVLHVFKTALDRFQNVLFYEVTSQPKVTQEAKPAKPTSKRGSSSAAAASSTGTPAVSNSEKIQLLQSGIEAYKKEIEQWNNVIREYNIENEVSENKSKDSNASGDTSKQFGVGSIKSKKDVSLLLPSFKERAGYSINDGEDENGDDDDDNHMPPAASVASFTEEQDREIKNLVLSVDNLLPKIDAVQKSLTFAEQALPELSVRIRDHMINSTLDSIRLPSMPESSVSGGGGGGSLFSSSLIPSY